MIYSPTEVSMNLPRTALFALLVVVASMGVLPASAQVNLSGSWVPYRTHEDHEEGGTFIVPGHGRICDEFDVVEYRDMVTIIRDRIQAMIKKGMSRRTSQGGSANPGLRSAVRRYERPVDDGYVRRGGLPESAVTEKYKIHKRVGPADTIEV